MGRPCYEPSPADRATVQHLSALGATHKVIASCIGTHGVTEKTLRKHFQPELERSSWQLQALAMSQLIAAIKAGEAWAICFWLKTRGGFRQKPYDRLVDEDRRHRPLTLADIDALIAAADEAHAQAAPVHYA
ncbi:MAG: hypothetical protein ABSG41_29855 [Bryobacteraceae bacterium]|jgi:hypothetical protein